MSEENNQTNETAEIIKDLQSKPQVPIKGNTADFLKKFARNPDGSSVEPSDEVSIDTEDSAEEVIGNDNEEKKPLIQLEKKKPGFVQKQIEENKRLKEELEKFKSEEIPKYTNKITELEELVKNSQSTAEANHYQEQLNRANNEKAELESNLTKEIQELRSKVEFNDITQSSDFQEKYVIPIQNSYLEAKELLVTMHSFLRSSTEAQPLMPPSTPRRLKKQGARRCASVRKHSKN